MNTIRQTTGASTIPLQNISAPPKPQEETEDKAPRLNQDDAVLSARPENLTAADLVAKVKAAQTQEIKEEWLEPPAQTAQPPATPPEAQKQTLDLPILPKPKKTANPAPAPKNDGASIRALTPEEAAALDAHNKITTDKKTATDHPVKQTLDWVGNIDGGKEALKFVADDLPDIARTPPSILGRLFTRMPSLSNGLNSLTSSRLVAGLSSALSHSAVKPLVKGLGRVAPFAGLAVTGFDLYKTSLDLKDPQASTAKKAVSVTKSIASSISSVAGVTALFLAPTGVGAVVAGGISLAGAAIAFGCDLALGNMK